MDISEVWNNLGYLAAPIIAFLLFRLARRVPRRWLRICARAGAILLILASGLALLVDGWDLSRTLRRPAIVSPDGKHVAVAYWTGVLFDENYVAQAHISVRMRHSPIATEVFEGQVISRFESGLPNNPDVRWLNDHQLLISNKKSGDARCFSGSGRVDGIEVLCQE